MKFFIATISLLCMATLVVASPPLERKVYHTQRINPHPPTIDGRLDDPVWEKVDWGNSFTQREPDDGADPAFPTAFKILYDDHNLYLAFRAFDPEPEKIVRRVTRRDQFEGDWVEVNIDSYHDHRTAFSFTLTAAGVKGDEAISNDGQNWDANWNPVWYAGVGIDDQGWTAEMRIPLSQLRFAEKEEHVWGIQVQRRIFREQERSVWQHIPQDSPGWVSYFGELHGIHGIESSRRIELLPYVVTDHHRFQQVEGDPFATGSENGFSGGLDAKIGVTSDLTLDATFNPDFGQVEADPSEVNLSAFETFFEEKRPFFIEGQNILNFSLMGGDGTFSNDNLFYSRRIGRSPQYDPDLDDDEFIRRPENSSIAAAVKLTGKTRNGLSIGILDAITDREHAEIDLRGSRRNVEIEPRTNYFLGRLQQDFSNGATSIGGMVTATNRDLSTDHLKFLNTAAYTGGLDFRHQWHDRTYTLDLRTSFSHIRGDAEAIAEQQQSSRRYYQRPDADYLTFDSTRTSLSGHGGMVSFNRSGNGHWNFSAGFMWRSPGLELNDVGFMRQADRIMQWTWLGYRTTNPVSIFRNFRVNFNQWMGWNFGGENVFTGGNINGGGQLKNFWNFWLGVGREVDNLATTALRGGPAFVGTGYWNQWYSISSDSRKDWEVGASGFNSWADEGDSRRNGVDVWLGYRPMDALSIRMIPFFNKRLDDLQYIDTVENGEEERYLFGRIDQKTLGITFRLNYSLTPNLSIQYYGQPFVSAGEYASFKRITTPRAAKYDDRFHTFAEEEIQFVRDDEVYQVDENRDGAIDYRFDSPDFNFKEFRSNLVVRWEYTPGSTLFLVWSQNRSRSVSEGEFSFRDDLKDLFDVYPDNVFLVKFNRWFSL